MSAPLTTGSPRPSKVEGKVRLYSNAYCPYAHRARLVLKAKNVPHEIVNINLESKPEWYSEINPQGKVPAIDTGSEIIIESLVIADYLDENYPENPLYPADQVAKQADKELLEKIAPLVTKNYEFVLRKEEKPLDEWVREFTPLLDVFEQALSSRGSVFFGGDTPGMVDYMLWPWGERAGVLKFIYGRLLPFENDQFPLLRRWRKTMLEQAAVRETFTPSQKHWELFQQKIKK